MGMVPPFASGAMFHPRAMTVFHAVPTYRNAEDNRRTRALFERLLADCAEHGWTEYRIHAAYQKQGMQTYDFNNGALHRLHETLKDAIDPHGIISAGRYDIWPKHLRERQA
jgi:FAD/FMN-containing dehydrogenase